MSAELIELTQKLGQPRVMVLGDLMLDRYIWGDAERISQEAPVILLRADHREERLGGASSVATMLRALGAKVDLVGVVGEDENAGRVRRILTDLGVEQEGVLTDSGRPTTVKERYIGRAQARHPQQMLRVDYETRAQVTAPSEQALCRVIGRHMPRTDIVLVSDYDKGVCSPSVMAFIIASAREHGVRVLADPIRGKDYRKYHGCTAITPNRLEAGLATGRTIRTTEEAMAAGRELMRELDLEAAVITLDKDGMALVHRDGRQELYPTRPRQVYDITGAGDMVLSMLGLAMAAGAEYDSAIRLANVAGGLEVEKIGVATVTREEIVQDLLHQPFRSANNTPGCEKVVGWSELCNELDRHRRSGRRIAFTNGCFDVLHAGHVQYLNEARSQADLLVVGLNSDAGVRLLKGPTRPVNPVEARATVLAGLSCVDFVTIFADATPATLIEAVKPDVLVKGADYRKEDVVGTAFVEAYGGRVHLATLREGYSTTNLLTKLKAA